LIQFVEHLFFIKEFANLLTIKETKTMPQVIYLFLELKLTQNTGQFVYSVIETSWQEGVKYSIHMQFRQQAR